MLAADAEDAAPAGCVSGLTLELITCAACRTQGRIISVPANPGWKRDALSGEDRTGRAELEKAGATRELRHAPRWSICVDKRGMNGE